MHGRAEGTRDRSHCPRRGYKAQGDNRTTGNTPHFIAQRVYTGRSSQSITHRARGTGPPGVAQVWGAKQGQGGTWHRVLGDSPGPQWNSRVLRPRRWAATCVFYDGGDRVLHFHAGQNGRPSGREVDLPCHIHRRLEMAVGPEGGLHNFEDLLADLQRGLRERLRLHRPGGAGWGRKAPSTMTNRATLRRDGDRLGTSGSTTHPCQTIAQ